MFNSRGEHETIWGHTQKQTTINTKSLIIQFANKSPDLEINDIVKT